MTSIAHFRRQPVRRVGLSALAVALSVVLAACGGDLAAGFVKLISAEARPSALTVQSGAPATFSLVVQCDARLINQIWALFFPDPLPAGLTLSVVDPPTAIGTGPFQCNIPGNSTQVNVALLTVQVHADASVPLGPIRVTANISGEGSASDTDQVNVPIDLTIVASAFGRNLLANPEFSAPVAQGLLPTAPGGWQGDLAASVPAEQGIDPRSAPSMLRFDATGHLTSTNTFASQQWQIVDVGAVAADIAAGLVRADASAWFNRVTGDASTDRRFDIRLLAFSGTGAELPAAYAAGSQLAVQAGTVQTTGDVWQQAVLAMTLPAGTTLLLVEIYAFEDVSNEGTVPEFAGHYADDISLVLTRQ